MARILVLVVLLANILTLNCQEEDIIENELKGAVHNGENPSYSFSYGVSDSNTGDIKTVWETKEGDTVKGHYSVLQPDGSTRTVEYSAGPTKGFTAVVNNEDTKDTVAASRSTLEAKSMRDFDKFYDYNEDEDVEYYPKSEKRRKPQFDTFRDYSKKKPYHYPQDLEPSEFTHSYSIKHPYDQYVAESHVGMNVDPNCKTKPKKEHRDPYGSEFDQEPNKHKYGMSTSPFKDEYERFENFDFEKTSPFRTSYKGSKIEDINKPASSLKHSYPSLPDAPLPEKFYTDEFPSRPKKKYRPYKHSEYNFGGEDNMNDYMLVPKKKHKRPPKEEEYNRDTYDDYRPQYSNDDDFNEDRYHHPPRGSNGQREVVRKVIKKRKPVINLLDIFDI